MKAVSFVYIIKMEKARIRNGLNIFQNKMLAALS